MALKTFFNLKSSKTVLAKTRPMHRIERKGVDFLVQNKGSVRMAIQLRSLEYGRVKDVELVSLVKELNQIRNLKKYVYIRSYPYLKLTKKPAEVRMGKGKGKFDSQVCPVVPGSVLIEVRFPDFSVRYPAFFAECRRILEHYASKFTIRTRVFFSDL